MTASESGGESSQIVTNPGYDDVYANITLYRLSEFKLQSPYVDSNRLYAPTVKPGLGDSGRGCYEVTANYESDSADGQYSAQNRLSVTDWCNGGIFDKYYTIDDNFRNRYIRDLGDGLPKATIEIAQPLGQGGEWKALIYNYSGGMWEELDARGPGSDPDPDNNYAWDVFETHYNPGPCPAFPTIGTSGFQVAVEPGGPDSNNYFRAPTNYDLRGSGFAPSGCFHDDHSGIGEYYTFQMNTTDKWIVHDPPSGNIPCTIDSSGYCAVNSYSQYSMCTTSDGTDVNAHVGPDIWDVYSGDGSSISFWEYFTETGDCVYDQTQWSPSEPSVYYNDPNLP